MTWKLVRYLLDDADNKQLVGHVEDEAHPVAVDRNQERCVYAMCGSGGGYTCKYEIYQERARMTNVGN